MNVSWGNLEWTPPNPAPFVPIEAALKVPRQKKSKYVTERFPITIYALVDQRDEGIRYIGVTNKDLEARLKRHLAQPTNAAMREWFGKLRADGKRRPKVVLLEYVSRAEWEDAERGWIHWCRERGELLNFDRGGKARDRRGRLRGFVPGEFTPPQQGLGFIRMDENDRWRSKVQEPGKETRPRLEPVAEGVFRRTG